MHSILRSIAAIFAMALLLGAAPALWRGPAVQPIRPHLPPHSSIRCWRQLRCFPTHCCRRC